MNRYTVTTLLGQETLYIVCALIRLIQISANISQPSLQRKKFKNLYLTPRLKSKFGERAFSYAGPAAWNRLPETIRQAQTQTLFKKLKKTFLFT